MSKKTLKINHCLSQILDSIPKNFDFEYCAVGSTTTRSFLIQNSTMGILKFTFKMAENSPINISHESGVLQVKGKQEITLSYKPKE